MHDHHELSRRCFHKVLRSTISCFILVAFSLSFDKALVGATLGLGERSSSGFGGLFDDGSDVDDFLPPLMAAPGSRESGPDSQSEGKNDRKGIQKGSESTSRGFRGEKQKRSVKDGRRVTPSRTEYAWQPDKDFDSQYHYDVDDDAAAAADAGTSRDRLSWRRGADRDVGTEGEEADRGPNMVERSMQLVKSNALSVCSQLQRGAASPQVQKAAEMGGKLLVGYALCRILLRVSLGTLRRLLPRREDDPTGIFSSRAILLRSKNNNMKNDSNNDKNNSKESKVGVGARLRKGSGGEESAAAEEQVDQALLQIRKEHEEIWNAILNIHNVQAETRQEIEAQVELQKQHQQQQGKGEDALDEEEKERREKEAAGLMAQRIEGAVAREMDARLAELQEVQQGALSLVVSSLEKEIGELRTRNTALEEKLVALRGAVDGAERAAATAAQTAAQTAAERAVQAQAVDLARLQQEALEQLRAEQEATLRRVQSNLKGKLQELLEGQDELISQKFSEGTELIVRKLEKRWARQQGQQGEQEQEQLQQQQRQQRQGAAKTKSRAK